MRRLEGKILISRSIDAASSSAAGMNRNFKECPGAGLRAGSGVGETAPGWDAPVAG